MTTINPDKLTRLDQIELAFGHHRNFDAGACAMEVVSWLADEGFTDAPECASRIVTLYTIGLNDHLSDENRQQLKPYLVRMIGTGSDGKDTVRRKILRREIAALTSPWLRLAGLHEPADRLDKAASDAELMFGLRAVPQTHHARIQAGLKMHGVTRSIAGLVADSVSAAVVDLVAHFAVDASFVNVAAGDVVPHSEAAIYAAVSAVTNAVSDPLAAAVAASVSNASPGEPYSDEWLSIRGSAYRAAIDEMERQINEVEALDDFRKLRDEQDGAALRILDKIITADA